MNHPFIKIYKDERELTVLFVVDVSGSSKFGTHHKFKNEISAEITPPVEDILARERMNALAIMLLGELGDAMLLGCDVEQAAIVCGISRGKAFADIAAVKHMLNPKAVIRALCQ